MIEINREFVKSMKENCSYKDYKEDYNFSIEIINKNLQDVLALQDNKYTRELGQQMLGLMFECIRDYIADIAIKAITGFVIYKIYDNDNPYLQYFALRDIEMAKSNFAEYYDGIVELYFEQEDFDMHIRSIVEKYIWINDDFDKIMEITEYIKDKLRIDYFLSEDFDNYITERIIETNDKMVIADKERKKRNGKL